MKGTTCLTERPQVHRSGIQRVMTQHQTVGPIRSASNTPTLEHTWTPLTGVSIILHGYKLAVSH